MRDAHEPDDGAIPSMDWEFGGDEPVEDTLLIVPDLQPVQERLAGFQNTLIIPDKAIGHFGRKVVVIRGADEFRLVPQSKTL